MPPVPKAKGSLILNVKRSLRRDFGDETLDTIIDSCEPEESREVVRGIVLGNQFYPETVIGDLLVAVEKTVGSDNFPAYAREIAKTQVNGVLKFLLRFFISPRKLSENNHKLWQALHDTGSLTVTHGADDKSHTVEIHDFIFPNAIYEKTFVEFHCGVLELTGAKNITGVSTKTGPSSYIQKYYWEY